MLFVLKYAVMKKRLARSMEVEEAEGLSQSQKRHIGGVIWPTPEHGTAEAKAK